MWYFHVSLGPSQSIYITSVELGQPYAIFLREKNSTFKDLDYIICRFLPTAHKAPQPPISWSHFRIFVIGIPVLNLKLADKSFWCKGQIFPWQTLYEVWLCRWERQCYCQTDLTTTDLDIANCKTFTPPPNCCQIARKSNFCHFQMDKVTCVVIVWQ